MKNIFKKPIAILMSVCMLMSVTSASVISASSAEIESTDISASEVITSGNFKYTILEDGTAQIEGTSVKKLEKIEVPSEIDGYTVTKIAKEAFSNEVASEIILPDTLTEIGYNAFYNCDNIKTFEIPEGVTKIEEGTFSACSKLTSVVLPSSVGVIDTFAFSSNSLEEVTFKSTHLIISEMAFWCDNLSDIKFTDSLEVISFGPDAISSEAFTTLNIPDSTKKVNFGMWAFGDCPNLDEINIPEKGVFIDAAAFYGTKWYENQPQGMVMLGNYVIDYKGIMPNNTVISIPEGTYGIACEAFSSKNTLVEVEFPDSLEYIGHYAFRGCERLKEIIIPDNVTYIGEGAFKSCKKIQNVVIPSGVTSISGYTFKDCYSLKNVTISPGVTSIGDYAFKDCVSLKNVIIPNSVTSIGDYAFNGCSAIKNILIPESVTEIGMYSIGYSADIPVVDFCIYGYKDSAAEAYADEEGISFKLTNDIDSNEYIDVKDVTTLQMHLAGYDVTADPFNVDVNLDGKTDVSDVTRLQLILAGI